MASVMEVLMKQRYGTEFLHEEKMASTDIHRCLLNVAVSTVSWWVVHFSSGDVYKNVKQALAHCWQKCTANAHDCVEKIVFCS